MTDLFFKKILFIQKMIDSNLRIILDEKWSSENKTYRAEIRNYLGTEFSVKFNREQLALLNDLNWVPVCSDGFVSISHCKAFGGFALSNYKIGFDVEQMNRIESHIIKRTSHEMELQICPRAEFLWVAKESGFKAHSDLKAQLIMTDLICVDWESHFENQVFSFRLKSEKTLEFNLNKGFIFSEADCLFGIYFK